MNILKINGVDICNPSSLQWQETDLDGSDGTGRNQQGDMFIDRIASKRTLSVTFPAMDDEQMSTLLNAIDDTFFEVEYPDPKLGKRNTMTVYVSDRVVPIYGYDKDKSMWLWQGMSIDLMER